MPNPIQITTGQNQKEVIINENFIAGGVAVAFSPKYDTTSGLTLGLYGGQLFVDGVRIGVSNTTIGLSASATNYVSVSRAGVFNSNTTAFLAGNVPLWEVVTDSTGITSRNDRRPFQGRPFLSQLSKAVTTADVTLTAYEVTAEYLVTTGTLTNNRNLIVPAVRDEWVVNNTCAGAFTLTIKTPSGSGIVLPKNRRVHVMCDGTNVVLARDPEYQDIAYAATIAPDLSLGRLIIVGALTGNITIDPPTNIVKGEIVTFTFVQDGTGGRTITWNAVFKKAADGAGTANQVGAIQFVSYDGTNLIQVGGALTFFS